MRTAEPIMKDPVLHDVGFKELLGQRVVYQSALCVKMDLDVRDSLRQNSGFLHGGVTLALLESCASWASQLGIDNDRFFSFGSHVDIHHINSLREGTLHGMATFDHEESLGERGVKEYWSVEARDDSGLLISAGVVTTRVVSKIYFSNRHPAS